MKISNQYLKITDAVQNFANSRLAANKLSLLIENGLSVYTEYSRAVKAAYFSMNEETFDFEFKLATNDDSESYFTNIHNTLVESGAIGEALNASAVTQYKLDDKFIIFISPLISTSGIIGLVEVFVTKPHEIELEFLKQINFFSHFFASSINEFILKEKDHNVKELVDQIVASRTINLAKKQQEIGSKLESLKWNLSMSIPHEVRTPLNQIIGFANYMSSFVKAEYNGSEDLLEIVGDIQSSAERLRRLFENYLYYANLAMTATNIDEIRKISEKVTLAAESTIFEYAQNSANKCERGDDVEINLVEAPIRISEEFLIKTVEELMDNALKYSEAGSKINISSILDDEYYYLTFKDHGRGMTKEQILKIDAYMQFDRQQYEQQGSGLGLAIVCRIMDLHSGEIKIDSKLNESTEITIKLPIAKNDVIEYN